VDPLYFDSELSLHARYFFIQRSCKGYLEAKIKNFDLLYDYASQNTVYKEEIEDFVYPVLNDYFNDDLIVSMDDIDYVNTYVSERLQYGFIYNYIEPLNEVMDKLTNNSFSSLYDIIDESETVLKYMLSEIRKVKADNNSAPVIDLSRGNFENVVSQMVSEIHNPSGFLKTGYKVFNEKWGGGLESARTYLELGLPGGGKSKFLLNLAESVCISNPNFVTKDPSKRPCVVLISQENSQRETFKRYFGIITEEKYNIKSMSEDEVFKTLELYGADPNRQINLKIIFKKSKSISTDDIYDIIEEVESDGEEVIALFHDYTKRIRPSKPTGDLRIDLGNVVDEFSTMSKVLDIPVVILGQMNRDAMRTVETVLAEGGKANIVKLLGSHNIGESALMIENADCVDILYDEFSYSYDRWFLTVKEIKNRNEETDLKFFAQPYSLNGLKKNKSRLVLEVDVDLAKSVALIDIGDPIYDDAKRKNSSVRGSITKSNYYNGQIQAEDEDYRYTENKDVVKNNKSRFKSKKAVYKRDELNDEEVDDLDDIAHEDNHKPLRRKVVSTYIEPDEEDDEDAKPIKKKKKKKMVHRE